MRMSQRAKLGRREERHNRNTCTQCSQPRIGDRDSGTTKNRWGIGALSKQVGPVGVVTVLVTVCRCVWWLHAVSCAFVHLPSHLLKP